MCMVRDDVELSGQVILWVATMLKVKGEAVVLTLLTVRISLLLNCTPLMLYPLKVMVCVAPGINHLPPVQLTVTFPLRTLPFESVHPAPKSMTTLPLVLLGPGVLVITIPAHLQRSSSKLPPSVLPEASVMFNWLVTMSSTSEVWAFTVASLDAVCATSPEIGSEFLLQEDMPAT